MTILYKNYGNKSIYVSIVEKNKKIMNYKFKNAKPYKHHMQRLLNTRIL